jgi:hypothetical protein
VKEHCSEQAREVILLNVISLIVAVCGLSGLLFSLRQSYRARLRQFEEKYVERYWSMLDRLSLEALSVSKQKPDRDDEEAIRRYILLCEDELQMRKNGYISDSTYLEWADGMLDQFKQPMFRDVWGSILKEHPGQHGVFPYVNLRRLLETNAKEKSDVLKEADPLHMRRPARMIRGLIGIAGV